MLLDQQRYPHKYLKRVRRNNKWIYVYHEDNKPANLSELRQYQLVIAHQNPTPIMVDPKDSSIVYGPPQAMGKRMFLNTNPNKQYHSIARNPDGSGAVYFYPESSIQSIKAKKAAKFLCAQRSIGLLDKVAEVLMRQVDPVSRQYGLAIWLNNNTKLRIGAHEDAASVDATERRAIVNQARVEHWSDAAKEAALESSRQQTFGLLTSRVGHIKLDHSDQTASWNFRGKGGKMITADMVHVKMPPTAFNALASLIYNKDPDTKVFPDVVYKRVWREYKKYGITPHAARGAFADQRLRDITEAFIKERPNESPDVAMRRLRQEIKEKISDPLGHSVDITMKAYVSETSRRGFEEAVKTSGQLQESFQIPETPNFGEALAQVMIWLEVGPGNEVI